MDDEVTDEPEWVFPAGAPILAHEWLLPPLLAVGVAVVAAGLVAFRTAPSDASGFLMATVPVTLSAAVALWIFGYRAYRDLTISAVEQYKWVVAISLAVTGLSLAFSYFGFVFFILAGQVAAGRSWRPLRILRSRLPRRLWKRTALLAGAASILSFLLFPLALALQFGPLIGLLLAGRVVAPLIFGFAGRTRPKANGFF